MRRDHHERGLTLVEIAISSAIAAGLMILGVQLANGTSKSATSAYRRTTISVRVAEAADQVTRDLQVAGIAGEDRNANGVLDADEDSNNSGTLEADWSLADGAAASSITFNRVERRWIWSSPVTYEVRNGVLVRLQGGNLREICRGVTNFTVTRTDTRVDISITSSGNDGNGETWSETAERRVYVRN